AGDGIRDWSVTGVQTCALPISAPRRRGPVRDLPRAPARAAADSRRRGADHLMTDDGRQSTTAGAISVPGRLPCVGWTQNALKVMIVRVSWMPGMVCTFSFTK